MRSKLVVGTIVAALAVGSPFAIAGGKGGGGGGGGGGGDKVTICHRTGSATNPFVVITVSRNALPAHLRHGDFIYNGRSCVNGKKPTPPKK